MPEIDLERGERAQEQYREQPTRSEGICSWCGRKVVTGLMLGGGALFDIGGAWTLIKGVGNDNHAETAGGGLLVGAGTTLFFFAYCGWRGMSKLSDSAQKLEDVAKASIELTSRIGANEERAAELAVEQHRVNIRSEEVTDNYGGYVEREEETLEQLEELFREVEATGIAPEKIKENLAGSRKAMKDFKGVLAKENKQQSKDKVQLEKALKELRKCLAATMKAFEDQQVSPSRGSKVNMKVLIRNVEEIRQLNEEEGMLQSEREAAVERLGQMGEAREKNQQAFAKELQRIKREKKNPERERGRSFASRRLAASEGARPATPYQRRDGHKYDSGSDSEATDIEHSEEENPAGSFYVVPGYRGEKA